ncbi:MAG: hypothetical protein Q8S33_09445 [Myxococcales bacterium]|nr:hypothetical protein [Myxococcales bacterium]
MRVTAALVFVLLSGAASAAEPWAQTLPAFKLLDPLDRVFTHEPLVARGAVVVVTAPTHSQGDVQKAWSLALRSLPVEDKGPVLVMLEDMSQSWFRPIVLSRMKSSYRPTSRLWLLLDEGGVTRKALGVPEARTLAFAFGPGGKLMAVETGEPTPEGAKRLFEAARGAPGGPLTPAQ